MSVRGTVELEAETFEARADRFANFCRMLADAGREDEDVDATHGDSERPDRLPNSMPVDRQRQPALLVAVVRSREYLAHIGRDARHAEKTRFAIEHRLDLVSRETVALLNEEHDAG